MSKQVETLDITHYLHVWIRLYSILPCVATTSDGLILLQLNSTSAFHLCPQTNAKYTCTLVYLYSCTLIYLYTCIYYLQMLSFWLSPHHWATAIAHWIWPPGLLSSCWLWAGLLKTSRVGDIAPWEVCSLGQHRAKHLGSETFPGDKYLVGSVTSQDSRLLLRWTYSCCSNFPSDKVKPFSWSMLRRRWTG